MTAYARQRHVLAVNDTQEILDLLRELLEEEGYRVTTSVSLPNIDNVKDLAPDVIVQELPSEPTQEQGWKFLTRTRLDPQLAGIPLVLCTAAVQTIEEPEMAQRLDRLGVRVVPKPFDIEELLSVLAEVPSAQARNAPAPAGVR